MISAPRVCGDDPLDSAEYDVEFGVLPAYAGMIPMFSSLMTVNVKCSPRMRG